MERLGTKSPLTQPRHELWGDAPALSHGGPRGGGMAWALGAGVGNTMSTRCKVPSRHAGQRKMSILATRRMKARADSIATGSGASAPRAARALASKCDLCAGASSP